MKRRRIRSLDRGKAPAAPSPEPVPEGHASDAELWAIECAEQGEEPWHPHPISVVYIRARRRIYNLGREHGRASATALEPE